MKFQLAVAALCFGLTLHAQTPRRVAGSTTVKGALEPKQGALEKAVGRHIQFTGNGTNAGLMSLVLGDADVAMLSTPLDEVVQAINEKTPGRIDASQLKATRIGDVKIVFIVNPHNRVRTLSAAQVADVLVGKITNWNEVGGEDAPIVVVSLAHGGPLLQEQLLHGQAITDKAKGVANATQIPSVVAEDPNAIGIISTAHVRGKTSVVQTDANIVAPLFLVTKSGANPEQQKLIESARKLLGEVSG
jgi:phosphate transport system substrate-binding protein